MSTVMADTILRQQHHRHATGIDTMAATPLASDVPIIEMLPNPDFSFPRIPPASGEPSLPQSLPMASTGRRPISMQLNPAANPSKRIHRRAASTLPSFSFNAVDSSGLKDEATPPLTPTETAPVTPTKRGHKRGGSEFVGGDSRFGMANALSSSPTKSSALPLPVTNPVGPPAGRRGHAHRRSQAMSSHDVSSMMQPQEGEPRTSSSLPNTPLQYPAQPFQHLRSDGSISALGTNDASNDLFGPPSDESEPTRPSSRARVGFKDQVDIIPRPLSVISSETESSVSTVRGHSLSNSISSMMTLSNPGTPSARAPMRPSSTSPVPTELAPKPRAKSPQSLAHQRSLDVEGRWLQRSPSPHLKRAHSESCAGSPSPAHPRGDVHDGAWSAHKKKRSLGHALGFDRRKSEPLMGMLKDEPSRLSAISVASAYSTGSAVSETSEDKRSSRSRLASWARSKIYRKSKDVSSMPTDFEPLSTLVNGVFQEPVPGLVPYTQPMMDLDAVFASQADDDAPRLGTPTQPRIEVMPASPMRRSRVQDEDNDNSTWMVDLDAALGPHGTPASMSTGPRRKQLHSSRLNKDFDGPGGHYNAHRRANSSPVSMMRPLDFDESASATKSTMTDVFEEEEPEEQTQAAKPRPASSVSARGGIPGTGISIVDSEKPLTDSAFNWASHDGLGIRSSWEPARPATSWEDSNSRLSTPIFERRSSSVLDETILEESSPVEALDQSVIRIVSDHEEPRTSSLTKSSDSSETPTLLGPPGMLPLPESQQSLMTPNTFQTSTFSTPELIGRQGSFDNSRDGTAASSITDGKTTASCATGNASQASRISIDDVPSLTSSRSTMMSTAQINTSRRDLAYASGSARALSSASGPIDAAAAAEKRRKRASIQSLSQLIGVRSRPSETSLRPQTAGPPPSAVKGKKEHRLKKLMFWKSKQPARQNSVSNTHVN